MSKQKLSKADKAVIKAVKELVGLIKQAKRSMANDRLDKMFKGKSKFEKLEGCIKIISA